MNSTTYDKIKNIPLISYNSTGWNMFKAQFFSTLAITHSIGVGAIQEHFLLKGNLYKLSKEFPGYGVFSIPAVKSNSAVSRGRPSCGLSIIYKKELMKYTSHIQVPDSHRVQAIKVKLPTETFIFINAYFPTDPKVNNFNEGELYKTLQDIKYVFDKGGMNSKFILMGDINTDIKRNTRFVQIVQNFITENNLSLAWNKFPCDFTYAHSQERNNRTNVYYSTIDHYLMSENVYEQVTNAMPLHLSENLSNHEPIYLKVKISEVNH